LGGTFRAYAIGDKVLTREGIRYLLFYDYDGPDTPLYAGAHSFAAFKTPNGWHLIAYTLGTAEEKRSWWKEWQRHWPSDYRLSNLNWLAPHSKDEFDFIMWLIGEEDAEFLKCSYYRDKAVFEERERLDRDDDLPLPIGGVGVRRTRWALQNIDR
jgi:hypothetical protein